MPAVKESDAGMLAGPESKFVGHPGLPEIPEGKAPSFKPLPEKDQLSGAVMSVSGIAGGKTAQAGVSTPQDVANLTGCDSIVVLQQNRDNMESAVWEGIDSLEGCFVAGGEPGVFVLGSNMLSSGMQSKTYVKGKGFFFQNLVNILADVQVGEIEHGVAALELGEEKFASVVFLGDSHETGLRLCGIKFGREILTPVVIFLKIKVERLAQYGIVQCIQREMGEDTGGGFHAKRGENVPSRSSVRDQPKMGRNSKRPNF